MAGVRAVVALVASLLLFMAVPVVAAETIAITELILLFTRGRSPRAAAVNRYVGAAAGLYFLGAVFYLLGLVPLYGMTLLETKVIGTRLDAHGRLELHATFVGIFLVVAHVAMIFGMLDPGVLGWQPSHVMPGGGSMPGMEMAH